MTREAVEAISDFFILYKFAIHPIVILLLINSFSGAIPQKIRVFITEAKAV